MAIDLSKIENLLINEGTETSPFILTDSEVTTLYKLAISKNDKISIKGAVNTTTGTILKYQSYQIKKAWPSLLVLAREVTTQDWSVQLLSNTLTEKEETLLIATNISIETLEWKIDDVSLSVISGSYGEQDVRDHIHFDNTTGRVYYDEPTSNAGWVANIQLSFWPSYIESPTSEDYRTVYLTVRAIAVTSVTLTAPSRIDESATINLTVAPYPTNNTKSPLGCKYSISTAYGILSPSSGTITDRTAFVYYAPSFKEVPYSEDEEGKYYYHTFVTAFYMFGSTTPSGTISTQMLMKNTAFKVTCDKSALVEGEQAEFTILGYTWAEVQKTMVVDETKLVGITEEELRNRCGFDTGGHFVMNAPTDNATFTADVKLYIAPPGAEETGERAFVFNMNMKAIGITSVALSPQTIGQNIPSVINVTYKPSTHTKGTISYGFACDAITISRRDDVNGIYNVFATDITTEGHDATAMVYSSYIGTGTPLLSATAKLYVQDIYFTVKFPDGTQEITMDEGISVDMTVDILHISELRRELTVTVTEGSSLVDADWIKSRLHFSDDISTDKIWFEAPAENISWKADIGIRFIARYIPEGSEPPYSQSVTMHFCARAVTGVEWQKETTGSNNQVSVTPYRKTSYFNLITLPYNNTKQSTLETLQDTPFSIGSIAAGLSMNVVLPNGRYAATANLYGDWTVFGYVDAFSDSEDFGTISENTIGSTTQSGTPSTTNIIYPKNLTLYDKIAQSYIELSKIDDTYKDSYIMTVSEEPVDPYISRKVGKLELGSTTAINYDGNVGATTACFYINVSDKATDAEGSYNNNLYCSHFTPVDDDITTTDDVDTISNHETDARVYIRISLETLGATGEETTEEMIELIGDYLAAQETAETPITIYYPLATETTTAQANTLYTDYVFFSAPIYHIYTANNPANQASVEFINNDSTATTRVVFGVNYPMDDDNNAAIEVLTTNNVRAKTADITAVPFFSGIKSSIDQYDYEGNLLTKSDSTAEKGEVNIWENFCGKYEEWTDEEFTHITWDVKGNTVQDGTPTHDNPIYVTHDQYYTEDHDIVKFAGCTWGTVFYGDSYDYTTKQLRSNMGVQEFNGTENWYINTKGATNITVYYAPSGHQAFEGKGNVLCSHFRHTTSNWGKQTVDWQDTISESKTTFYMTFSKEMLGIEDPPNTADTTIQAAMKAWCLEQYNNGTPFTLWYPKTTSTITYDNEFYTYGQTHRRYTISKVPGDDDTEGDTTKTNKFNSAFVYNTDGTIPNRFFLSRFVPGWHNNDTSTTISMAKGLKSQQRTIDYNNIAANGCYYKNDAGELKQIKPLYYGPLLAYSWLAYITYGTLNLKNAIGNGASRIAAEAQIFADDSGTELTPGVQYASLYIINNGLLTADNYQNYDFNILNISDTDDVATKPITSFKIRNINIGSIYTVIDLGTEAGTATTFTATNAVDYYSLNSCFSETGYSEKYYLDTDNNPVISGYGANSSNYNDTLHPVRCLNVENMWGGGNYTIGGTAFVGDEDDPTIVHPILWDPEDPEQDVNDSDTWDTLEDVEVVPQSGTWDVGSYKYHESKCGWPNEEAQNKVPYRGFNVYNRPNEFDVTKYNWVTGTYSDWGDSSEFQGMCGLGQTSFAHDSSADYTFVEYLESNGPQYIDLGYTFNDTDELWAKAAILTHKNSYSNIKFIRPKTWNSNNNRFSLGGWQSSNSTSFYFFYGAADDGAATTMYNVPVDRQWHIWYYHDHHFDMTDKNISVVAPGNWGGETDNLVLFGYDQSNQTSTRVYEIWQKRDGYYLYDLVPCYRTADKKPGMYDRISGQFLTNANTATTQYNCDFLCGPEIDTTMYQEIDYTTTSGNQYVNTGVKLNQSIKLVADITPAHSSTVTSYIGGTKNISGTTGLNIYVSTDNKLCYDKGTSQLELSNADTMLPNERHTIEIEQTSDTFRAKIDGTLTYTGTPSSIDTSLEYYLFNINEIGAPNPSKSFKGKFHSLQLYLNGELVRSYIPVYNKSTAKYGIYDIQEEHFNGNEGGGDFTGANVLQEVDSLYFNGQQYIDTGWTYKPLSKVDVDMIAYEYPLTYTYWKIFGCEETDGTTDNKFTLGYYRDNSYVYPQLGVGETEGRLSSCNPYYPRRISAETAQNTTILRCEEFSSTSIINDAPAAQTNTCFLGNYRKTDGTASADCTDTFRTRISHCNIYEGTSHTGKIQILDFVAQNDHYAWIDTNYKPNNNTKVEIVFNRTGAFHPYYGATSTWSNASFGCYDTGTWGNFNSDTKMELSSYFTAGVQHTLVQDKNKFYLDGTLLYTIGDGTQVFQSSNTLSFCACTRYSNRTGGYARTYSFKIWEYNEDTESYDLKENWVPARRTSDGAVGFYERVAGTFSFSSGSAEFIDTDSTPTGEEIDDASYVTYSKVKEFTPVYNVLTKKYGMYETFGDTFYPTQSTLEMDAFNGRVEKIEYIKNLNGSDPALYNVWNIDTGIPVCKTSKITVDMDVERASPVTHDMCIVFSRSYTSYSSGYYGYLCYSDNSVQCVTLIERTQDGSKVSWTYSWPYPRSDYEIIRLGCYETIYSGIYHYKRVTIYGTDGTTVLADLIPARCGLRAGMYDVVNHQMRFNTCVGKWWTANTVDITPGADLDDGVPGDPGVQLEGGIEELARVYGTL